MRFTLRFVAMQTLLATGILFVSQSKHWQNFGIITGALVVLSFFVPRTKKAVGSVSKANASIPAEPSILFFDVETSGLPLRRGRSYREVRNWPRVVSLGWVIASNETGVTHTGYEVIKPSGFVIPQDATAIHGISQDEAAASGKEITEVLALLLQDLEETQPTQVVAHNLDFDLPVISAEFHRLKIFNPIREMKGFCTMRSTTQLCKLPGNYGDYKWPKLEELVFALFGRELPPQHNAREDCTLTLFCYCELSRLGKIGSHIRLELNTDS
jgi:DNA polymerase-3 subunit epsilon